MINPNYVFSQVLQHGLVLTVIVLLTDYLGQTNHIPVEWMMLVASAYALHVAGSILTTQMPPVEQRPDR
jgi:hypothetical protein